MRGDVTPCVVTQFAACQDAGVLENAVVLETGLPGPVVLRALTTADADAFADHVAGDLPRLGEHLPWPGLTDTPDGATAWLGPYERREDGRVVVGGVWYGDALVGGALLFHHQPDDGIVELGCWLTAAAEGGGVAAAACRVLIGLARSDLGAERVEWHCSTGNTRSRRLAERLGFRHEGTLRSNYVLRGERLDTDVLSLVGAELDPFVTA
jgi:RimJ/RimL family protein N-acetyltransferase